MDYKNSILLLVILVICGCTDSKPEHRLIEKLISTEVEYAGMDYIMIIPNAGCPGCITGAESLYMSYKDREDVLFVFTNFSSRKNLLLKLEIDVDRANVILDRYNQFSRGDLESIYPSIVYLTNSKRVLKIEEMSPTNFNSTDEFIAALEQDSN